MTAAASSVPHKAGAAAVWLSALLLFAVVALAGLADASAAASAPQRIERCDGVRVVVALAADAESARAGAVVRAESARAPRPRPRTRDGQRRGLPPCRAPTC